MDHQVRVAHLVEEAFEHNLPSAGQHAQGGLGRRQVQRELLRRRGRQVQVVLQPAFAGRHALVEMGVCGLANPRHRLAQFVGAAQALAEPEWHRGRLPLGVLHHHLAGLHLGDAVRHIAELEDVARQALEGEVLVEGAHAVPIRQQHHVVVELVGDHARIGDGGEPRAAARAQHAVDGVVVQVGAAPAAAGGVAVRKHLHDLLELPQREISVWLRAPQAVVQRIELPFAAGRFGDDVLCERVKRLDRHADAVKLAAVHRVEQGGAFQQIVERQGKQPPLRNRADGVAGAADTLQEGVDRARRAKLAHQVDVADVDAEFEGTGGHQRFEFALLEPLLRVQAMLARETAMVRGDVLLAEPLGEVARNPFRNAALVDENQRRAMLSDQLGEPVVHLAPDFSRHHRSERRARHLDREIAVAHMARIDDLRHLIALADEEMRHLVQRLHGGRQADAHWRPLAQRFEPFQRKHQVRTPLAAGHRMQLIDDHALHRLQHRAARVGAEQDVQGLRRCHQDVRWRAAHALALRGRCVAGAHRRANADVGQAHLDQPGLDAGQRFLQVLADVVGERLQRRHVEHVHLVRKPLVQAFAHQLVNG